MSKKTDKQILFERMGSVAGMPLNENITGQKFQKGDRVFATAVGSAAEAEYELEREGTVLSFDGQSYEVELDEPIFRSGWGKIYRLTFDEHELTPMNEGGVNEETDGMEMPMGENQSPEQIQSSAYSSAHNVNDPAGMGLIDAQNAVGGYQAQQTEENKYQTLNDYLGEYLQALTNEIHRVMGHGIAENKS